MNDFKIKSSFNDFVNSEAYQNLQKTLDALNSLTLGFVEQARPLTEALDYIKAIIPDYSNTFKVLQETAKKIGEIITKELDDPDSFVSYYSYYETLTDLFWVMPYKATSKQIKDIIKDEHTEKEFDSFMLEHFNDSILKELFIDINNLLPENQKVLFSQCINSFSREEYALCSLGLYSIIDYNLSFYLSNKGLSSRRGIFGPIVKDMVENEDFGNVHTMDYILLMMNKNVNDIYEGIDFNGIISIKKNKDTNRHASIHGKYCSNKRESDLMLFNSLYWLLGLQNYLTNYKGRLKYNKTKRAFEMI